MRANLKKTKAKQVLSNAGWCTLLFAASRAMGGDVINGNAPTQPLSTQAQQNDLTNNQMEVFIPSGTGGGGLQEPFRYQNIIVRPHVDYQLQYGDGVQSTPGNPQSSFIHQLSPGVTVDLGSHW